MWVLVVTNPHGKTKSTSFWSHLPLAARRIRLAVKVSLGSEIRQSGHSVMVGGDLQRLVGAISLKSKPLNPEPWTLNQLDHPVKHTLEAPHGILAKCSFALWKLLEHYSTSNGSRATLHPTP